MRRTLRSRVTGLCTMIFMAHLSLVGSDLVCASHAGAHSKMAHAMTHASGAGTGGLDSGVAQDAARDQATTLASVAQSATDDVPCEVPSTDHCCDAMTGCAVTLATTDAVHPQQMLVSGGGVASSRIAVPASRLTAPETPPPKA